jgi:PAS domain S-box-containing protein
LPTTTRFQNLLEAMPDALVGVDEAGIIRFLNRRTESLFGYERGQLIGQRIDSLVPESLQSAHPAHRTSYGADPAARPMGAGLTLTGRCRDGTEFPVDISLSSFQTKEGLLVTAAVRDVTEQRKAFEAAQRLAAIVENSDDAIIGKTLDGIISSWNPAAERIYGYTSKEIIGKLVSVLSPPELAGEITCLLGRVKAGQAVEHFETLRVRRGGEVFPASLAISPIRDGNGTIVGASTITRDVTERKRADRDLQRMATAIEFSGEAIITSTPDSYITGWNPAAKRLFGYTSEEMIGKSSRVLSHLDRAPELREVMTRLDAGEPVEEFVTERVRKDGSAFSASLTVSPIRDADGAVAGAVSITRDVTEQVQAREALAEAGRQYRLLAENASDLVVLTSPDRLITWVSPSVSRTLGWATEDLIGTQLVDLIHPDDAAAMAALRDTVDSGQEIAQPAGGSGGSLLRIRTKAGQYRWMSGSATAVTDESGVQAGVVSGLRDVDELVRTREAAKAGEAAVRATMDSLMDPHVLLEAVRDETGQIADFVYVEANPAACTYNAIDHENLVGAHLLDLQPGSVGHGLLEQYRQVVETGEPLVLDDTIYAQELLGGQERRYDVRATRVRDGISYTWRDVTDRYAAARWLAESEEHYRLLAENASDVVMRLSPDHIFEWVSGSICDVLGWREPALAGHQIEEFVHPEDLPSFLNVIDEAGPDSTALAEFRFRRSDHTYRWVACRIRVKADENGTPVAVVGSLVDVQNRKAAEAQELTRLAELEQFHRLTIGREIKMIELKKEIEYLRHGVPDEEGDPGPTPD